MWVLKFNLKDEEGIFSWRNKKFRVKTYAYRTGSYVKGNKTYVNAVFLLDGKEENKKEFIKSLEKDKLIKNVEIKENLVNCLVVKPKKISLGRKESVFYSLGLIHIKPVFTDEEGIEYWELGSWDRKPLQEISKISRKQYNGKILSFRELKISESDFLFFSLYPKLTEKQKHAFLLALENGYYEFPRKIELEKLAKIMKSSYTTFQFHLRKAERKIMNSVGYKI